MDSVPLVTSATVVKGDALVDDGNGLLQRATSSSSFIPYVAWEAVTTAAAGAFIEAHHTFGVEFEADTNAAPAATDRYTMADLTDHDTLDESTSSVDVFLIHAIVGATSDNKVRGRFMGSESTTS